MSRLVHIEKFSQQKWFLLVIAFFASLDAFVFFIPTEALLIAAALVNPKRWAWTAFWVSVGSAFGATLLGFLASRYGSGFVSHLFPELLRSKVWLHSVHVIQHHGSWGLTVVSLSPVPQHAAVAIAGLAHLSVVKIFLAVLLGRAIKYSAIAWCAINAPNVLRKLRILPKI
jgi:membrane protein YqaA with SNARE-associated domain